jgi:hypothetical protein
LDKEEARPLAQGILAEWIAKPYEELLASLDQKIRSEVRGASKKRYGVQVEVFHDGQGRHHGDLAPLRVLVAIDDGGWSAFVPLCVSGVVHPTPSVPNVRPPDGAAIVGTSTPQNQFEPLK